MNVNVKVARSLRQSDSIKVRKQEMTEVRTEELKARVAIHQANKGSAFIL